VDVKVVAGRLGHSSTSVTQNVYQHRVEQLDRAAAEKVAGMLFGARKKPSAD
jgi:integrase